MDPLATHRPDALMIRCPHCQQPSPSVKAYTMARFFLFILIGAWWQTKKVVACPSCMRKEIALSTLINLVPANILMVLILPWHTALFAMTFAEGHSSEVVGHIR